MSFPNGPDPKPAPSDPTATLDGAQHTQLHNDAMERIWNIQEYLVGGDGSGGLAASLPSGGIQSVKGVEGEAEATWDPVTGEILFKIPRGPAGTPGAAGTNGKDGTQITSGTFVCPKLEPSKGPQKFSVSFPANAFAAAPKVFLTPVQKTTASTPGGTTSSVQSVACNAFKTYSGKSPWEETGSTTWTGQGATKTKFLVGRFAQNNVSSWENQRSLTVFPAFAPAAGAVASAIRVSFTVDQGLGEIVFRPYKTTNGVLPSNLNPGSSVPKHVVKKAFASGTKYTETLPAEWAQKFADGEYDALAWGPNDSTGTLDAFYGVIRSSSTSPVTLAVDFTLTTPGGTSDVTSRPVLLGVKNISSVGFDLVVENLGSLAETVDVQWMAIP